jgi:hypothetical protein
MKAKITNIKTDNFVYYQSEKNCEETAREYASYKCLPLQFMRSDNKILFDKDCSQLPNSTIDVIPDKNFVSDFIYRLLFFPEYIINKIIILQQILNSNKSTFESYKQHDALKITVMNYGNISKQIHLDVNFQLDARIDYEESMLLLSFLGFVKRNLCLIEPVMSTLNEIQITNAKVAMSKIEKIYICDKITCGHAFRFRFMFLMMLSDCVELQNATRRLSTNGKYEDFLSDLKTNVHNYRYLPSYEHKKLIVTVFVLETCVRFGLNRFVGTINDEESRNKLAIFKSVSTVPFKKKSDKEESNKPRIPPMLAKEIKSAIDRKINIPGITKQQLIESLQ